jgi:hypothetical protein
MTRWPRALLAVLLLAEALHTAFYVAGLVPSLAAHDARAVFVIIARGFVGAVQLASGTFLLVNRPSAPALAQLALALSAVVVALEVGFGFAPTSLDPTYRWPIVLVYWIYALGWIVVLRRSIPDAP